uniref:Uncharacterized protein n=1 Tax=Salix viminalis TaxID=40686 RepID=A0A6N2MGI0_SALVM
MDSMAIIARYGARKIDISSFRALYYMSEALSQKIILSGGEGRDVEPNILPGSLNLRIHRRGDSARDSSCTNGSCGSPSSSQNDRMLYQASMILFSDVVFRENHHYLIVYHVKVGFMALGMESESDILLLETGNALCVSFEECCLLEKLTRHPDIVLRSSLVLCVPQEFTDVRLSWYLAPVHHGLSFLLFMLVSNPSRRSKAVTRINAYPAPPFLPIGFNDYFPENFLGADQACARLSLQSSICFHS